MPTDAVITINGDLTLDQTSGIQDDDDAIGLNLAGLDAAFITFLTGLTNAPSAGEIAFADDVEAVISSGTYVTVAENDSDVTNLYFSDASGNYLDGDQVWLDDAETIPLQTVDGDNVYLWSVGDNYVIATTSNVSASAGDLVAAFYLDPADDFLSASIQYVTFIALDHPIAGDGTGGEYDDTIDFTDVLNISASTTLSFDFDNLDSGNFLHVSVGSTDVALVVTGRDPVIKSDGSINKQASDSVNTSQGGTNATVGINDQMFKPGNIAVFSLVVGQTPGTYTDIDDLNFTDHFDVTDASIFISQVQGNPATNYTVTITALTAGTGSDDPEDGRSYIDNDLGSGDDLGLDPGDDAIADDDVVIIQRVVVRDETGAVVTDTETNNAWVTFNDGGTSVTVEGFDAEWTIQWFTDDDTTVPEETFNRFLVEADEGKFDIGRIDISQGVTVTEPVGDSLFVDDDGPQVTVDPGSGSFAQNLDETTNPDGDDTKNGGDTYNLDSPAEDDPIDQDDNGDLDDVIIAGVTNETVTISNTPTSAQAIGSLESASGVIAGLFDVTFSDPADFGTDGPGDLDGDGRTDELTLILSSETVWTNLVVTELDGTSLEGLNDAQRTVYLVAVSDTVIEGRIPGSDGIDDDDVVALRITLNDADDLDNASITTEQFLPIDNDASETVTTPEDPSLYDEEIEMVLESGETLKIKLEVVVEDGDDDTATDDALVTLADDSGSYLSLDDDGPSTDITDEGVWVIHDETAGVQDGTETEDDHSQPHDDNDQAAAVPAAFSALGTVLGWAKSASAVVSVNGTTDFGSDGPALSNEEVWSLDVGNSGANADSGFNTDDDYDILLNVENGIVVGRIDADGDGDVVTQEEADNSGGSLTADDVAIAISIDQSGYLSLAQYVPINHPTTDPDEWVIMNDSSLIAVLTVTDGDGDVYVTTENIGDAVRIEDDRPAIGPIPDGAVDFMSAATAAVTPGETNTDTHSLSGSVGTDVNDSNDETLAGDKTYTFTENFTEEFYILDKAGTDDDIYIIGQRTNENTKIEYRQAMWDGSDWVYDSSGTLYFTNELDQSTGQYTFTVLQDPPPNDLEFDFASLAATKFLFGVVSDDGDGLMVIGSDPEIKADGTPVKGMGAGDLINTSKGGGETTIGVNNQMFTGDSDPTTAEQGAYFTYTEGLTAGTHNDADDIDVMSGTIDVTMASLQVSQTQAAGSQPTGMKITVYDYDYGTDFSDGQDFVNNDLGTADPGEFVTVIIYDEDGTTVLFEANYDPTDLETGTVGDYVDIVTSTAGYDIYFSADGSEVWLEGLQEKDWVDWETAADHNQVLVEATAGKFDIGKFVIGEPQPTPDLLLSSEVQITDFDGDYATDSYDVLIDGTGIYDDDVYDLTPVV